MKHLSFIVVLALALAGCQVEGASAPDRDTEAPTTEVPRDSTPFWAESSAGSSAMDRSARTGTTSAESSRETTGAGQEIAASRRTAITRAVQDAAPAVVSINVLGTQRVAVDPWFQHFFGQRTPTVERQVQSVGSGFVISPDGYVVTNDHVISLGNGSGRRVSGRRITVSFPDGRELDAQVVGTDPITDIALLKVEPDRELPNLSFGSSADVIVGEWVIALGNPFGLFEAAEPSVTVGVVSARNRNFEAQEGHVYRNMIQTDAAINQGNSGGPLINALGEVIGVNTFIISAGQSSGSVGVGFAVPAGKVARIVEELRQYGEVRRSFNLGLAARPMNERIAQALDVEITRGLLVDRVQGDSPAEEAGIQPYDVIVSMGGENVADRSDVIGALAEYRVGDEVPLTVVRRGKRMELVITLRARE